MHTYTCRFTLQEGGKSLAKKKSIDKWLDQAMCKPKKNEGTKRQRKDNNLNTRGLADD